MRGHLLLRPHICDFPNFYSATKALKVALSIDTTSSLSYRHLSSKRASSSQTPKEIIIDLTGTGSRENDAPPRRPIFHARQNHDADVIVHDLRATLDAHRSTNRASVIRPVTTDATSLPLFMRPEIENLTPRYPKAQVIADRIDSVHRQHGKVPQKIRTVAQHQLSKQLMQIDTHSMSGRGKEIGKYTGVSPCPAGPWSVQGTDVERPWLEYHHEEKVDGYSRLRAEIMAFHAFISPTADEVAAYKNLIADVQYQARESLPDNPIEVIGSQRTGLATSLSDLDFRLSLPEFEKPVGERGPSGTRQEAQKASLGKLRKLIRGLSTSRDYEDVVLRLGRVPIISAVHRATQLTVQIQALSDSSASREYVLNYLAEFPTLRPLYTLIKTMLEMRKLRDVHAGGLGAYSTFMLVVAALKQSQGTIARNDIGRQLLSCLKFYGETDLYRLGISVEPPGLFCKTHGKHSQKEAILADPVLRGQAQIARVHPAHPYLLCLQDPANPLNDLGAKAYNIKHVQALFRTTRSKLWALYRKFDHTSPSMDELKGSSWSAMLDPLVGADYGWFQLRRARVAKWGRLRSQTVQITPCGKEEPSKLREPMSSMFRKCDSSPVYPRISKHHFCQRHNPS